MIAGVGAGRTAAAKRAVGTEAALGAIAAARAGVAAAAGAAEGEIEAAGAEGAAKRVPETNEEGEGIEVADIPTAREPATGATGAEKPSTGTTTRV